MRNFVFGIVFALMAIVVLLRFGMPLSAQQNRLQKDAEAIFGTSILTAVCDTGNGTLLYIVGGSSGANAGKALGLQFNGCTKR